MTHCDFFLKIDGIEGESKDAEHRGEIDISSFRWSEMQTGTSASGGASGPVKVATQEAHFTMSGNKASPKIMLACVDGEQFKRAVLTCRKAGKDQQEFLKYTFSDVLVSSFQNDDSRGGVAPTETFTLNCSKIELECVDHD
jgi:type VI secretion system secreted protein Hcp